MTARRGARHPDRGRVRLFPDDTSRRGQRARVLRGLSGEFPMIKEEELRPP